MIERYGEEWDVHIGCKACTCKVVAIPNGNYVRYIEMRAALLDVLSHSPTPGSLYTYVRSILGDDVVDEFIAEKNKNAAKAIGVGIKGHPREN